MSGWIDLHCHWVAGVDDGARTTDEGREILRKLTHLGFGDVVATPHMRPGLFDNSADELRRAFRAMCTQLQGCPANGGTGESAFDLPSDLPRVRLGSEHYFDDQLLPRLAAGAALPYPGGKSILIELYDVVLSPGMEHKLFEIQRLGLVPVIAHPERYRPLWGHPERLERLLDLGSVALLDACALVGKYGERVRRCALAFLERELYGAACSDAHRPADVDELERALAWIEKRYGSDELVYLFHEGPRRILSGAASTESSELP